MKDELIVRANYDPTWMGFGVNILRLEQNKCSFAVDMTLQTKQDGERVEPLFFLTMEHAQQLMDDLWNSGIRPQASHFTDVAFDAQNKHLQDMRTIVSKKLGVEL